MKIGKALQNVLDELENLGFSERKVLNLLKAKKNEIIMGKEDKKNSIKFTALINDMIFDGRFEIENPTTEFLHYLSYLKSTYNNSFVYYCLSEILMNQYYTQGKVHEMNDNDRCRVIMYFLKNNLEKYLDEYTSINENYENSKLEELV